jgi:glycosyltransferase involved in cell wall biosynthesis
MMANTSFMTQFPPSLFDAFDNDSTDCRYTRDLPSPCLVTSRAMRASPVTTRPPTISVIVCAFNEDRFVGPCLHALLAQTRPADEIILVDNASTDRTADVAAAIPGVRVVHEPRKGLVRAREAGRRAATGDILAYLDADCRAPIVWLERLARRFDAASRPIAVTGPYRFYDWDWFGRTLLRAYDYTVAPATHLLVQTVLGWGAILYGGNFAVRADALERIGGFDTSIEFHGEDTNLGRRLAAVGRVRLATDCYMYTSARRYVAMGKAAVFRLYVRNFWSEILRHRPADRSHLDIRS